MQTFLTNSITTFGTKVLLAVLQVGWRLGLAVFLGAGDQGRFFTYLQAIMFVSLLAGVGQKTAGVYYLNQPGAATASILSSTLNTQVAVGLLLITAAGMAGSWIPAPLQPGTTLLMIAGGVAFALHLSGLELLVGISKVGWYNVVQVVSVMSCIALLIAFTSLFRDRLAAAVWAYIASLGVGFLFSQTVIFRHYPYSPVIVEGTFRPRLLYGLSLVFAGIIAFANFRIDFFMVQYFRGVTQSGVYSLAITLGELVWFAPDVISVLLLPSVASRKGLDNCRYGQRAVRTAIVLSTVSALGLAAAAPVFLRVFGREYPGTLTPFFLLLPGMIALSVGKIVGVLLVSVEKVAVNNLAAMLMLVINVALNCLLIPFLGLSGAAIATTVAYIIGTGVGLHFYAASTGGNLSGFFRTAPEDWELCRQLGGAIRGRFRRVAS